jgi:two-component system sensor histidine kinase HydH
MFNPTPARSSILARKIGWVLFVFAILIGAALVTTTWSSFSSVRGASGSLINGQAGNIFRSIGFSLRNSEPEEPTQELLQSILTQESEQGLLYLALFDLQTEKFKEAGVSGLSKKEMLSRVKQDKIFQQIILEERVIFIGRPPPRPSSQPITKNGPVIIIEFFPSEAKNLAAQAQRTLIIGGIATLVLLLSSLALAWLLQQQTKLERQHAQEQQLAALGSMSAVVAHELRNPLTSLKGHSQLLLDSLLPEDPSLEKAERIVRDASRLEALTTNLLAFIKTGKIERQQADPRSLALLSAEEVDNKRVELSLDKAPFICSLDPDRMQQALVNLIRNALDASPPETNVEVSVALENGRLIFSVRDHGAGLPPGQEEKVFTPFYTTRTHGAGLGLAVSRRIVEAHEGTLTAANHPEGGAIFSISLPL